MKFSRDIYKYMSIVTAIVSIAILGILLFRHSAIPKLSAGAAGRNGTNGADGQNGVVDYGSIHDYVDQQIAALPKPTDGKDAAPVTTDQIAQVVASYVQSHPRPKPTNGIDGKNGSSCSTTQVDSGAIISCSDGTSSMIMNGTNGQDGTNGQTPTLRCNTNKNRWEAKYSGTDSYTVIKDQNGNPVPCIVSGVNT